VNEYVLSRLSLTVKKCYSKDSAMEFCPNFHSGMTCELLTESHGEESSMSSVEAFHAKTLAHLGKAVELLETAKFQQWLSSHGKL
jgi:hypothetical protein